MDEREGLIGVTGSECAWYQDSIRYPNFEGDWEAPATAKDGEVKKRWAASCIGAVMGYYWDPGPCGIYSVRADRL